MGVPSADPFLLYVSTLQPKRRGPVRGVTCLALLGGAASAALPRRIRKILDQPSLAGAILTDLNVQLIMQGRGQKGVTKRRDAERERGGDLFTQLTLLRYSCIVKTHFQSAFSCVYHGAKASCGCSDRGWGGDWDTRALLPAGRGLALGGPAAAGHPVPRGGQCTCAHSAHIQCTYTVHMYSAQ